MREKQSDNQQKAKFIFNPHAGKKRSALVHKKSTSLEEIKKMLQQYQIETDYFPTKYAGHATELAKEGVTEKYGMIIAAGGDGTISEVANGIVGTDMPLGIIPLGTFMNTARMFSIPIDDTELSIALLKIKRTRKIDVACITHLEGEKLSTPHYYLENAGIGLEALVQRYVLEMENGKRLALWKLLQSLFDFYNYPTKLYLDTDVKETTAMLVSVSNGPYTGAKLHWAPDAKLNDHRLTVSVFNMTKWELFKHFFAMMRGKVIKSRKIKTYQVEKVKITSPHERLIHADARVYGMTPVEIKIIPNALTVITGFPTKEDTTLVKRTYMDP